VIEMITVDDQMVRDALRDWSRTLRLAVLLIAAGLAGCLVALTKSI
jgi:hypothetical protein